ncbi:MAG: GDCCVxC domain-containing (seleno)protein [Crocinitomicaceae bacterium]
MKYFIIIPVIIFLSACSNEAANEENEHSNINVEENEVLESPNIDSSLVTCPSCKHQFKEKLPTEYCLLALDCDSCGETMHPKNGDCCVFCTHGDVKCPSMQE